jgi:predicted nucleic-acid-binding protein
VIALDTNVLARLLVETDSAQARRATDLVRSTAERGERVFVSDVVVCEVAWVLAGVYAFTSLEIAAAIRTVLQASELAFRDTDALERALASFEAGPGDFPDFVIRELALSAGCTAVATFDKALLKQPGFVSP